MRVWNNLGRLGIGALIGGFLVAVLMLPYFAAAAFGAKTVADAVQATDDIPLDLPAPETTTHHRQRRHARSPTSTSRTAPGCRCRDIADYVQKAVISIEDRRFYEHHGVDWRGTARAALGQLKGEDSAGGGSTLTQQ